MHAQHVVRDAPVHVSIHAVHEDEEEVEAGEQGVRQPDVARGSEGVVVLGREGDGRGGEDGAMETG